MVGLGALYKELQEHDSVDYQMGAEVCNMDGEQIARELLRLTDGKQVVDIANMGSHYIFSIGGEEGDQIKDTLKKLKLPRNFSGDLGERVFYVFLSHLKDSDEEGEVHLQQSVVPGTENQYLRVLKKIAELYDN